MRDHVYVNLLGPQRLLDVQADLLRHLSTRVVVPLLPVASAPATIARLNPMFEIDGERYVMMTNQIAAVQAKELGAVVVSLAEHHAEITAAIDILLTGV
jgi:toxin CcdB